MVFQKILQRKRVDTRDAAYSAAPTSVFLFMVQICPSVCLVVTRGYSGSDRSLIYVEHVVWKLGLELYLEFELYDFYP